MNLIGELVEQTSSTEVAGNGIETRLVSTGRK